MRISVNPWVLIFREETYNEPMLYLMLTVWNPNFFGSETSIGIGIFFSLDGQEIHVGLLEPVSEGTKIDCEPNWFDADRPLASFGLCC